MFKQPLLCLFVALLSSSRDCYAALLVKFLAGLPFLNSERVKAARSYTTSHRLRRWLLIDLRPCKIQRKIFEGVPKKGSPSTLSDRSSLNNEPKPYMVCRCCLKYVHKGLSSRVAHLQSPSCWTLGSLHRSRTPEQFCAQTFKLRAPEPSPQCENLLLYDHGSYSSLELTRITYSVFMLRASSPMYCRPQEWQKIRETIPNEDGEVLMVGFTTQSRVRTHDDGCGRTALRVVRWKINHHDRTF